MQAVLTEQQLNQYQDTGYLIFDTGIEEEMLNDTIDDMEPVWGNEDIPEIPVAFPNRIQCAWRISDNCRNIATNPRILAILEQLYRRMPLPFQTLNFRQGTEQHVHSDSIHFNSEPFGMMCGVWVALEDIGPDQGPLIYYPGSNQLPEMNFNDMNLEAGDFGGYNAYLDNIIAEKQLEPAYGILKKGQALIWAANLIHGGARQNDKSLTRHSQVTHYYFEDVKCWRPTLSKDKREYFSPEWILDKDDTSAAHSKPGLLNSIKKFWKAR